MPARETTPPCAVCRHPKARHTARTGGTNEHGCAKRVYISHGRYRGRMMPCDCPNYQEAVQQWPAI